MSDASRSPKTAEVSAADVVSAAERARWQRVSDIVADALEIADAGERQQWVNAACGDDTVIRAEVEQFLRLSESDTHALERAQAAQHVRDALADAARAAEVLEASSWLGRRLGAWEIVAEIARGGMGAVYKAIRADDAYRKDVAIKLIRDGRQRPDVVARFLAERQILASLDHPNIARLLDGGTTEEGLPYFVMEYVDGEPITRYAQTHALSLEQRLTLFESVCGAVQFAHQRLVVHRDLKPGNILVTQEGDVKLLDFGIAKLIEADTGVALATQQVMTPAYASPEQVRGEAVTTATDIYALGVILYELLTGSSPYRAKPTQPLDLAREICEREPDVPSSALTPTLVTGAALPALSAAALRKLRNGVRGDLDNIVLMALRKEPDRRYASAEQLADDVRRYRHHLPVRARADTFGYRAGKFVGRNRWAVAFATVAVIGLIGGIALAAWQASEAREAQARAEKHFATVRKFANNLIFDVNDQIKQLEGAAAVSEAVLTTAKDYLDTLRADLGRDPALQREVAIAYGRLGLAKYDFGQPNLGKPDEAMQHFTIAYELFRQAHDAGYEPVRSARDAALAQNSIAKIEANRGRHAEAIARLSRADVSLASEATSTTADRNYLDRLRSVILETRADIRDGSYGPTSELNLELASKDIDEALRLSKSSAATLAPDRLTKAAFDLNLLRDRKARILSRTGQLEASLAAFEEARVEAERIAALDESNLSWRLAASNVNSAAAEAYLLAGDGPIAVAMHQRGSDLLQTKLATQTRDVNFSTSYVLARAMLFRATYLVQGPAPALALLPEVKATLGDFAQRFPVNADMAKNLRAVALVEGRALLESGRDGEAAEAFTRALGDSDKLVDGEGLLGATQANLGLAAIATKGGRARQADVGERLLAAGEMIAKADAMAARADFDLLAQLAATHARFDSVCKQTAAAGIDAGAVCTSAHLARHQEIVTRLRKLSPKTPITL